MFQFLTGGKKKVDKYDHVEYDGKFKDWIKLCGLYFRYPCGDFEDLYWDDDYEEGQSIKTWFRKKYTGPYKYSGNWEHYSMANAAAKQDMTGHSLQKCSIGDMMFDYQGGMDELLERIPLIELMIPRGIKEDPEINDKIKFLQKRQEKEEKDKQGLAYKTAFDMNNRKLGKAMTLKVATVAMRKKPIGLAVDGLSLMDDVGGIHGYIDFLRTIHGEDPDEKQDMKEWAKWMGWTGRMNTPETLI